jgi:cell division protein FtsQ
MKFFKKLSTINIIMIATLLLITAGYVFYRLPMMGNENIIINVDDKSGNFFVSQEDVEEIIDSLKIENPNTNRISNIGLKTIEAALRQQDFILDAQVSRDLKGNIIIDIQQEKPIARLMGNSGKGAYINKDFEVIDLSDNFSARVMIISGAGADTLMNAGFLKSEVGQKFGEFIEFIRQDEFWEPQVAMMEIDKDFEIEIYPQIGQHKFEFGQIKNYKKKFNKMKLFYDEIIPKKGWGEYRLVKVQYNGQIVCR